MNLRTLSIRLAGPLAVSLLALFAAQPLFVNQLTCSDDSAFHIGRAVNLEALIESGHYFPRWSPYMAHGYGYPFFNYYPPLTSYMLVGLHKLGFIYPVAFHIALFLCLWVAGQATYALARDLWGEAAGVASAAVYLTAPYFAYDLLFRGNLAESFALALPPLVLFCLGRALRSHESAGGGQRRAGMKPGGWGLWDLSASVSFAALLLTHNASALATAPLIAGYVALLAARQRSGSMLVRGGLSLALGLGLSAYFWVPALLETDLVQTDKLLVPPIFTYYTNYLTPGELLAPPSVIDPLLINPSPAKALGLVASALALAGLMVALRTPRLRAVGVWLAGFALFYALLTLPVSQVVWDTVPLLKFIQFPWRMLGPAALCAALLAGAAACWLPGRSWQGAAAVCLAAALGHLSWWYPRYCAPFQEATLAGTLQYELDTFTLGTTAKGEYLPRTAPFVPDDLGLAQALIRGERPLYLSQLPPGASLSVAGSDPLDYRVSLSLPGPAAVAFNQFYFPGWAATVDGRPLSLAPAPDSGLITFSLPEGSHEVRIYFGATPLRLAAGLVSVVSVFALALALGRRVSAAGALLGREAAEAPTAHYGLPLAVVALMLVRPLLIDRVANPLRYSDFDGQTVSQGAPVNSRLASGLTLYAADFPGSLASGDNFEALLYAGLRAPTPNEYRPRFDVQDANGLVWNDGNSALPPRWHKEPPETRQWPAGQYAQWARRETLLPGTPPGDYKLVVTVFDRSTLAPDSAVDENGNPVAPVTALGSIHVTRPASPPRESELDIQHRADFDFGPLTLLGYNIDRAEARPGDPVFFTFFLRANDGPAPMPDHEFNLFTPSYPTSQWQPGDIWRFQVARRIPAEAESGLFYFALHLAGAPALSLDLAPVRVTAPERAFAAPPMANRLSIVFGGLIELAGYDLEANGEQLVLRLLWHALETTEADLSVFVHIEDEAGHIVAQSDGVPAEWSRPTTGWLPGEYILDPHRLAGLPAGEYKIYVGLTDRLSGERFAGPGGDRVLLGVYKAP